MKSTARNIEKKFGGRIEKESRGVLWQRGARESNPTRVRMVHKGGDSDICAVQEVWREEMSCEGKQEAENDQGPTKIV